MNVDIRKNPRLSLAYLRSRRGMLELDIILKEFLDKNRNILSEQEIEDYISFMMMNDHAILRTISYDCDINPTVEDVDLQFLASFSRDKNFSVIVNKIRDFVGAKIS